MASSTTAEATQATGLLAAALERAQRPEDPERGRRPTEPLGDQLLRLRGVALTKLSAGWTWRELTIWLRDPTGPHGTPLRDADGALVPGIPASQSTVRRVLGPVPKPVRDGTAASSRVPASPTPSRAQQAQEAPPEPGSNILEKYGRPPVSRPADALNPR